VSAAPHLSDGPNIDASGALPPQAAVDLALPSGFGSSNPVNTNFWDVANTGYGGMQADHAFSEVVQIEQRTQKQNPIVVGLAALLGLGIIYGTYEYTVNDVNILDTVSQQLSTLLNGEEEAETVEVAPPPVKPAAVAPVEAAPAVVPTPESLGVVPGNPYWHLPNSIAGYPSAPSRSWTPEEEETWRGGLSHRFVYQHFKTVMDVRKRHLSGSESILWDAMQDSKFWTRMQAAIGLAEFNIPVATEQLEQALGQERSELVANFFERFVQKSTAAQRFIMRQSIRLLDERGRLVVLRALSREKDKYRALYLIAATQDPGPHVQRWVQKNLGSLHLQPTQEDLLLKIVRGELAAESVFSTAPVKKHDEPKKVSLEAGATSPDATNTKQTDFEDFKDSIGDVEFYNEDPSDSAVNDTPDLQTFDVE
jgi:hypothetical protein